MHDRASLRRHTLAGAALVLAGILVFSLGTTFVSDLWTVAAIATVLFATAAVVLGSAVASGMRIMVGPTLLLLLALPAWGVLQLLSGHTIYPFATLLNTILLSGAACAFWIATETFQESGVLYWFRDFLVFFAAVAAVLTLTQMLAGNGKVYWLITLPRDIEPMGPFRNRDRYAAFIELLFPLVVARGLRNSERSLLYALAAAVMFGTVVAGGSRAGLVCVTTELLAVLFIFVRDPAVARGGLRTAGFTMVLVIAFASALGWGLVMHRFTLSPDVLEGRREYLISSVKMWKEHPLLGFGLGTWPSVYPRFALFDPGALVNHAHNDWAEWAADGGTPFALIYLLIAWRAARRAWSSPEALGVLVVFLHSLVDFNFREYSIVLMVSVLLACAEAGRNSGEPGAAN